MFLSVFVYTSTRTAGLIPVKARLITKMTFTFFSQGNDANSLRGKLFKCHFFTGTFVYQHSFFNLNDRGFLFQFHRRHLSIFRCEDRHVFCLARDVHQVANSARGPRDHNLLSVQQRRGYAWLVYIIFQHIQHCMGHALPWGLETKERRACVQVGYNGHAIWCTEGAKTVI